MTLCPSPRDRTTGRCGSRAEPHTHRRSGWGDLPFEMHGVCDASVPKPLRDFGDARASPRAPRSAQANPSRDQRAEREGAALASTKSLRLRIRSVEDAAHFQAATHHLSGRSRSMEDTDWPSSQGAGSVGVPRRRPSSGCGSGSASPSARSAPTSRSGGNSTSFKRVRPSCSCAVHVLKMWRLIAVS